MNTYQVSGTFTGMDGNGSAIVYARDENITYGTTTTTNGAWLFQWQAESGLPVVVIGVDSNGVEKVEEVLTPDEV